MKQPLITGGSFGLTSGIITTLGLLVGLNAGTHSQVAVIGGIMTIAVADALSDAFGMHIAQESGPGATPAKIWFAAAAVFVTKFVLAMSFLVPLLLFELTVATLVSIAWGFGLLAAVSYWIAVNNGTKPWKAIAEHLAIGTAVVVVSHLVGVLVSAIWA